MTTPYIPEVDMLTRKIRQARPVYSRKFYVRILLSFILLTFIIVLSTSLIFSSIYLNSIYKQISIDSINNMERFSIEFDNVFAQLKQSNIFLRQFSDVNF